jgi:hypothetical protein
MAEHQSASEIERDIEHERRELRETIDEFSDRLTFDDIWDRIGGYVRQQGDLAEGFARVAREKPVALGLTALGIGLLLFGPKDNPARLRRNGSNGDGRNDPYDRERFDARRDYDAEARALLADAEFDETSASGPKGSEARSDPWSAPHHREAPDPRGASGAERAASEPSGRTAASAPPAATGSTRAAASGATTAHEAAGGFDPGTAKPSRTSRGDSATPSSSGYPDASSGPSRPQDKAGAKPSGPAESTTKTGASSSGKRASTSGARATGAAAPRKPTNATPDPASPGAKSAAAGAKQASGTGSTHKDGSGNGSTNAPSTKKDG